MKVDIGKVFYHMTRGSCNPIDSVKSDNDCSNLVYNIRLGLILIRIRSICHIWLVKVIICSVGISESKEVDVKYGSLYILE